MRRTKGGLIHKSISLTPECVERLEAAADENGRDFTSHIRYVLEIATGLRRPPHVREDGSWDPSVSMTRRAVEEMS